MGEDLTPRIPTSPQSGKLLIESGDIGPDNGFTAHWRQTRYTSKEDSTTAKYPESDVIDRLTYEYAHAPDARTRDRRFGELVQALYRYFQPQIAHLINKYAHFDAACDHNDMSQSAYEAIISVLRCYKNSTDVRMKVGSFLDWKVRNACAQGANGAKDSYVEVVAPEGTLYKRVPYNEWQAMKRKLEPQGYVGTTVRPHQLSALFENEGGPDDNIAVSITDADELLIEGRPVDEEERDDEPLAEPDRDARLEIDSIYLSAKHLDIESSKGQGILLKLYGVFRHQLSILAAQHGADWSVCERTLQHAAVTEIAATWKSYDHTIVPNARYSLYLEATMRRKMALILGQDARALNAQLY